MEDALMRQGRLRGEDERNRRPGRKGFSREKVEEVIARKGKLSVPEILRHRVRYFRDGSVFGTAGFVDQIFERDRSRFGPNRKTGTRRMRGAEWGDPRALRDLRKDMFGP